MTRYFECFTCGEELEYDIGYDEGEQVECHNCSAVMSVYVDVDIRLESPGIEPHYTSECNIDEHEFYRHLSRSLTYWEIGEITKIAYFEIPLFIERLRWWIRENYFEKDSITTQIKLFWSLHKEDWKHYYIHREKSHESLCYLKQSYTDDGLELKARNEEKEQREILHGD